MCQNSILKYISIVVLRDFPGEKVILQTYPVFAMFYPGFTPPQNQTEYVSDTNLMCATSDKGKPRTKCVPYSPDIVRRSKDKTAIVSPILLGRNLFNFFNLMTHLDVIFSL